MQKLDIFIEENALGSVCPVEIVSDAPISTLIPALVETLKLPQTDLFGRKLSYQLRCAIDGRVLPDHQTLRASGIGPGERLTLEAYDPEGANWGITTGDLGQTINLPDPAMHSAITQSDADEFAALSPNGATIAQSPAVDSRKGNVTRRALLVTGGAALGAAGVSLGYAAYHNMLPGNIRLLYGNVAQSLQMKTQMPKSATKPQTHTPAKPFVPKAATIQTIFTGHQQTVRSVAWSPDSRMLVSGGDDNQMFIWGTNSMVHAQIPHPAPVQSVAWSPDSKRVVSGSGMQVAFFDAQTGQRLAHSTHHHTQTITSVAWAAQGLTQVVTGAVDKRAIVWDTANYRVQTVYTLHTAPIEAVSWAADGLTVATSSIGGYVRLWAATSGMDVQAHYQDAVIPMRAMSFSPVGKQLAVGGNDGIVRFWNAGAGMCQNVVGQGIFSLCADVPLRVQVSQQPIRSIAWSPDGRFVAVGADDGVMSLWDVKNMQEPLLTMQQPAAVHSVTWSPDNKHVALAVQNTATILALK
ncbi:MAG TPA: EsaB/YukD family protein [Ktedonobacteraceae bacterium]|nr:EsaB/YukD family protein [Ktedonobacteraceae bacterium]